MLGAVSSRAGQCLRSAEGRHAQRLGAMTVLHVTTSCLGHEHDIKCKTAGCLAVMVSDDVCDAMWLQRGTEARRALYIQLHSVLLSWNLQATVDIPAEQRPSSQFWEQVLVGCVMLSVCTNHKYVGRHKCSLTAACNAQNLLAEAAVWKSTSMQSLASCLAEAGAAQRCMHAC